MTAEELIAEGYVQISSAFRRLARVPAGKTALEALADIAPDAYRRIMRQAEDSARGTLLRVYSSEVDVVEVSIETFAAFKKLGGDVA